MGDSSELPLRILIADDDALTLRALRGQLASLGQVTVATNGDDAWDACVREQPHIVVADWEMPGLSGPDLIQRIRAADFPRYTYALLVTARTGSEEAVRGLESGADDYLTKPFDPRELRARVAVGARLVRTEERLLLANASLEQASVTDPLTQLLNRRGFDGRLQEAIALHERGGEDFALVSIDLDRFKMVNDSLGHAAGDALLQSVAERLRNCVRATDAVGRLGGDEFAIVLRHRDGGIEIHALVRRLLRAIEAPHTFGGREISTTASIGVAIPSPETRTPEALLRAADAAMYEAKERGGNRTQTFTPGTAIETGAGREIENELRSVLGRGALRVHLQPIVRLAGRSVCAVEALARWPLTGGREYAPSEFIPVAEQSGLIEPLGLLVARTALGDLATLRRGGHDLRISINFSPKQLLEPDIAITLAGIAEQAGVPTSLVDVEITEEASMQHPDRAARALASLRSLGFRIAIDDFGVGYASLERMKAMHAEVLKIDKLFLQDVPHDRKNAAIVQSTVELAHRLGMEVVAEGVELPEQLAFLEAIGCDMAQGYLFSPALSRSDFEGLLMSSKVASWARGHAA